MLRVFIGCDEIETVAFHVLANSIRRQASVPVAITPVWLQNLDGAYLRDHDTRQSNEFSFSRFLVPWMCNYEGLALFMDCDMLVRCDIKKLFDLADPDCAVQCVQHDYVPRDQIKFLGNEQHSYPRKNWSSLMLFNNAMCQTLTPEYIRDASAADLHRMTWANEDIGSLHLSWNWLVGEYDYNPRAKILHWTVGGPWFEDFKFCDYSTVWFEEYLRTIHAENKSSRFLDLI